jgi:acyl-coenzyme A thioesterase PaaI-like protein
MQPRTHLALNPRLCGTLRELTRGHARVELTTVAEMAADQHGLVHGGFVFGLADAAAMFAIDEPNVVLGSAETRFLAPVVVGETLLASATVTRAEGKKHFVEVEVTCDAQGQEGDSSASPRKVFQGTFVCFVPAQHVLASRGAP